MGGQGSARAASTDLIAMVDAPASGESVLDVGLAASPISEPEALGDPSAPQADSELYLEVWRGDRATGKIGHFTLRNGLLWCAPAELRELGLAIGDDVAVDSTGLVSLDSLQGLHYHYEVVSQRLVLEVPSTLRPSQQLGYAPPEAVQVDRGSGLLLGYDTYARNFRGDSSVAVATLLRAFGRFGSFEQSGITRAGIDATAYQRLDSRWTYSDPSHLWTWTAGDLISGGLSWTRPVRMGGVQWRRNFGTRPDLITYPMPSFAAQATVPSSVELLVNDVQQFSAGVDDGPFVLNAYPQVSGAGVATLVVRDALGRTTQTTVPIYSDNVRLARGLTDFSLEAGMLRHDFGGEHDGYHDDPVFSASLRRGATDNLTMEAHAEAGSGLGLAGLGAAWSPGGRWGLVSSSAARSQGTTSGWQYSLGYQWLGPRFGIDLLAQRADPGFRDLGALESGHGPMRLQDRASLWVQVPHGNISWTSVRWRDALEVSGELHSMAWTQMFGPRFSLAASLFHDRIGGTGASLSFNFSLGERSIASLTADHAQGRSSVVADVQQAAPYDGGWSWRAQAGDRQGAVGLAQAGFRGRYGEAFFGVDHDSGGSGAFFQANGSVAWMDGHAFASRHIQDSFAVVSTSGVPSVPVLYENRVLGTTDARGYLLVPELRGWQRNRLAIDPDALGAEYRVPPIERFVTPADAEGVLVDFGLQRLHPALAVLLGPDGLPVPAGARGRIAGQDVELTVGFDGEAYIEDAKPGTVLEIDVGDATCRYHLPAAAATSAQSRLGPLRCEGAGS
jgi:outer membrane usher protein